MPLLIIGARSGSQDVVYTTGATQALVLEAISADVTTIANPSAVEVVVVEQSGRTIARSRTKAELDAGVSGEVTFAPYLPDTAGLPGLTSGTIIQTGLAMTPLIGQCRVTMHPLAADAQVTEARLWVEAESDFLDDGQPPSQSWFLVQSDTDLTATTTAP